MEDHAKCMAQTARRVRYDASITTVEMHPAMNPITPSGPPGPPRQRHWSRHLVRLVAVAAIIAIVAYLYSKGAR